MSKVVGISDAGSSVVFATLKREQRRLCGCVSECQLVPVTENILKEIRVFSRDILL
jgi:hypothetical protein